MCPWTCFWSFVIFVIAIQGCALQKSKGILLLSNCEIQGVWHMIFMKILRFPSHQRAKVRHQGCSSTFRAQHCTQPFLMIYVYVFLLLFCFYRCCCCYCWVQGICMSSGKKHHAVKAAVWYTYRLWWTRWAPFMIADTKTYNILRFIKIYNPWQSCWNIVLKLQRTKQFTALLLPSIQSWGVCCFLQVAQTVAQHCLKGEGKEKRFPFLSWQKVREALQGKESPLILSRIVASYMFNWTLLSSVFSHVNSNRRMQKYRALWRGECAKNCSLKTKTW